MESERRIMLVAQKTAAKDDPAVADMFEVGCVSTILQMLKLPDGTVKVLVEGTHRARVSQFTQNPNFFQAFAEPIEEFVGDRGELDAIARAVVGQFDQYIRLNKKITPEVLVTVNQIDEPAKLADTIAAHLALKIPDKQALLETASVN